jgi:hypothetical protein
MASAQSESLSLRPKRTPALWHAGDRQRQSAGLIRLRHGKMQADPAIVGPPRHVAGHAGKEIQKATADLLCLRLQWDKTHGANVVYSAVI